MKTLLEHEYETVAVFGKYSVVRTSEGFSVHYYSGSTAGSIPFNNEEEARTYCRKRMGCTSIIPTRYEPKHTPPLWQMDLRHKLEIAPDMGDPVSRLLINHIYGSESREEMAERLEYDIASLQKALRTIREGK